MNKEMLDSILFELGYKYDFDLTYYKYVNPKFEIMLSFKEDKNDIILYRASVLSRVVSFTLDDIGFLKSASFVLFKHLNILKEKRNEGII